MNIKNLTEHQNINYYTYPFPTGRLYIFGDKKSIKLIAFGHGLDHKEIEKNFMGSSSGEIGRAIKFLDNYLLGKNAPFPAFDMGAFTVKEISLYEVLKKVPFGQTVTYGELAAMAGFTGGARFAGNTMAKNLFPVIIPCHRVIKADGTTGNYSSGKGVKRYLLQHERAILKK